LGTVSGRKNTIFLNTARKYGFFFQTKRILSAMNGLFFEKIITFAEI